MNTTMPEFKAHLQVQPSYLWANFLSLSLWPVRIGSFTAIGYSYKQSSTGKHTEINKLSPAIGHSFNLPDLYSPLNTSRHPSWQN
jgi:hypothetical protein